MKIEIKKITVEAKSRTLNPKYTMISLPDIYLTEWEKIGIDMPSSENVYRIMSHEVQEWVESQPIHMWKCHDAPPDDDMPLIGSMYVFTEEMEVWFLLRWA